MSSTWSSNDGAGSWLSDSRVKSHRASPTLESARLLEEADAIDRRVTISAADARFTFRQCLGPRARFADDQGVQALAEPRQCRDRVGSEQLPKPAPRDDAAPIRQVVDMVDFHADERVLVHHPNLQTVCRLDDQAVPVIDIGHRDDVGSALGVATESGYHRRAEKILNFGGRERSQHAVVCCKRCTTSTAKAAF